MRLGFPADRTKDTASLPRGRLRALVRLLAVASVSLALAPGLHAQSAERLMLAAEARYHDLVHQTRLLEVPAAGVGNAPDPDTVRTAATPGLVRVDMRLALLRLARPAASDARDLVLAAQGGRGTTALSLAGGRMDLPQLLAEAERVFPETVAVGGLGVPLIVEEGATLVLGAGAVLTLNRAAGAFLVNFGTLDISGGGIVAAGPANPAAPDFAPFVVTAGQGVMTAQDAYFAGLGFGSEPVFAGLSVVVSSFYQNERPSALTGSVLRQIGSTVFLGGAGVRILGNRFLGSRRTALILRATRGVRVHSNTFLDGAAGAAIEVAANATGTDIRATEIFRPRESGIALLPGSKATRIHDVTIWRPGHNGIRAESSDCVAMSGLRIMRSRQEGVLLRASRGVTLSDSLVIASGGAGVLVADLSAQAITDVTDTLFARNLIGIETAAPGRLRLHKNDFQQQFPRFLAGDVQFMTPDLLRDLTGKSRLVLAGGGAPEANTDLLSCPTYGED